MKYNRAICEREGEHTVKIDSGGLDFISVGSSRDAKT